VREHTRNFAIINDGPWGTMCARVGCMPSKALIAAANAFHARHSFQEFGIRGRVTADVPAVMRRVRALRDDFVRGNLGVTRGVETIDGRARLLGPGVVRVGKKELRARRLIIATGSSPTVPSEWRDLGLLTTDTLFEQKTLPRRMAVVGLGAIGVEFSQALARLGVDVTAFEAKLAVSGLTDPKVNAFAIASLRRELSVHLGVEVKIEKRGRKFQVGGVTVDQVLVAMGRRPNIEGLGLETLGVPLDEHGMPEVDPHTMRLGTLPVFMAGDVEPRAAVLHEAKDEGTIAGLNATAGRVRAYPRRVPLAIAFADPNIAFIGKRFEELDHPRVTEARFESQSRAVIAQVNKGIVRLYSSPRSGKLLGAELCAPAGEHLAHLLALAMSQSLTLAQLGDMPWYHPTLEEGLKDALKV